MVSLGKRRGGQAKGFRGPAIIQGEDSEETALPEAKSTQNMY